MNFIYFFSDFCKYYQIKLFKSFELLALLYFTIICVIECTIEDHSSISQQRYKRSK